ncbi:two-component system response regulator [Trichlorobacter sp.]|uniref:response regulator n=1 Tax=Trichlorobacter sp. TaxID=2911007 RepID=UPI002A35A35E|nr:response regulator [Trichlorobacter sp.]MDY0383834.1 response regulator [Trichlorobacter sp.]
MSTTPTTTVLLIDDDPFFLRVLSSTFRQSGYTVFTAHDGIEGIKLYLDKLPQVVISDLIMPRLGGVSTCKEIRRLALERGDQEPIIILLTSMIHEAPHQHEVPDMGARYHIPKSSPALDIVILVEQLLEQRQSPHHDPA